jgi:hypothetical protein
MLEAAEAALEEVKGNRAREEGALMAEITSWSEKIVVDEEALARIGEQCKSEQESIETEVAGVRQEISAADTRMQELQKSVAFAQQELAKMEEELASVEARAVAGLIARETIARVAEQGGHASSSSYDTCMYPPPRPPQSLTALRNTCMYPPPHMTHTQQVSRPHSSTQSKCRQKSSLPPPRPIETSCRTRSRCIMPHVCC